MQQVFQTAFIKGLILDTSAVTQTMEVRSEQINDIYFSLRRNLLLFVIGSRFFQAKEIYIPIGQKTGFMVTLWLTRRIYLSFTCDPL